MMTEIVERTDGIPLFVEEMTKAVLEAEGEGAARRTLAAVPSPALAVPASLHASLMARLDRLGPAKEVAQIGAAIGREFSHSLLAAVVRKPEAELNRHSTVSFNPACYSGRVCRHTRPICSNTPWFRMPPMAPFCASRDARFMRALPKRWKASSRKSLKASPSCWRVTARKPADRKSRGLWGKAGQRSLARSALVEAAEQFTRALGQIAACPLRPRYVGEHIKLQVALITPLIHVKGYAAPETKAAVEQARLLIEQAETLGEPPEDPLLLFSVLYGSWVAHFVAFNGDALRELTAQFLALAEKQAADCPAHDRAPAHGCGLDVYWRNRGRSSASTTVRWRFTILPSIVHWRRDLDKTSEWRSLCFRSLARGCLAIPMPRSQTRSTRSRMRARSAKPPL